MIAAMKNVLSPTSDAIVMPKDAIVARASSVETHRSAIDTRSTDCCCAAVSKGSWRAAREALAPPTQKPASPKEGLPTAESLGERGGHTVLKKTFTEQNGYINRFG